MAGHSNNTEPGTMISSNHYITLKDVSKDKSKAEADLYVIHQTAPFTQKRKSGIVFLIIFDLFLLIWDHLTILGLLLAASLRWTWPPDWIYNLYWLFLFNLDIFNFSILKSGLYSGTQNSDIPTKGLVLQLWLQELVIGIIIIIICLIFGILVVKLNYSLPKYIRKKKAYLRHVALILVQILFLPIGISAVGRLFHCTNINLVADDNNLICWQGGHWAYIFPALCIFIPLMCVIPIVWLIYRVKNECGSGNDSDRHEIYMMFKQIEYTEGLDEMWRLCDHQIFASFTGFGRHFRVINIFVKIILILVFAAFYQHTTVQASLYSGIFGIAAILILIVRPFRIFSFNIYLCLSLSCLCSISIIGALRTSFDPFSMKSVFLTDKYCTVMLYIIEGIWLLFTIIFIIYILIHWYQGKLYFGSMSKFSEHTKHYIHTLLNAKALVNQCQCNMPLLAPVHQLSNHILLLNALRTEAEWCNDPLAQCLWTHIEELTQLHEKLSPHSLFAMSVKSNIQQIAKELKSLMPKLANHMNQREYDLLLARPVKRRMLFKLHCMAIFMDGILEARERLALEEARQKKLWSLSNNRDHGNTSDIVIQTTNVDILGSSACLLDQEFMEDNGEDNLSYDTDAA